MCTREEIKFLVKELLRRIDQVALLGARVQFNEECDTQNRFAEILRFQKAYLRYFVFANDPYTELVVPITISSLALFIANITSQNPSSPPIAQTSRTIIEFLQVIFFCLLHHSNATYFQSTHVPCCT